MAFFISHCMSSQELFFKAGRNFTNYEYKNSSGQSLSGLKGASGTNYEFGVEFFLDRSTNSIESVFSYSSSLTLNQFNDKGGNVNSTYEWNTNYIGVQNMLYLSLMNSNKDFYCLKVKAGLNTLSIFSGQQYINNVKYDLTQYDEFKGIFLQPVIGADFRLELNRELSLNVGYAFSKAINISNKSSEELSFSSNLFQVGVQYSL